MRDLDHLYESTTEASGKLLLKSDGPYCMDSVNDPVVHIFRADVTTTVSIDRLTRYRPAPLRRSHRQLLMMRTHRRQPPQQWLPGLALPYRTGVKPLRSEWMEKSTSARSLVSTTARKQACNVVLGSTATAVSRRDRSPSSCYRSPSKTSTGERLKRSERVSANRDGHRATPNRSGSQSQDRVTRKKASALLRKEVSLCHRYGPLENKNERRRSTAKRASKNIGTRELFTGSCGLRSHDPQ